MKKNFLRMATALVAVTSFVACSDDIEPSKVETAATGYSTVKFSATLDKKDNFVNDQLGINAVDVWQVGEKVKLVYDLNGSETSSEAAITEVGADGKATIAANIAATQLKNTTINFIYPADFDETNLKNNQDGSTSADNLKLFNYAKGLGYVFVKDTLATITNDVKMTNPLAISKFTVKNGSDTDITAKVSQVTFGGYTVNTANQAVIYVASVPVDTLYSGYIGEGGEIEGTITGKDVDANNNEQDYTPNPFDFTKQITVRPQSGKLTAYELKVMTTASAKALNAVTGDDLYKVIASDGKVYPIGTPGITPVALIVYVGAAGDVDADSTSFKGLAMALTNTTAKAWSLEAGAQKSDIFTSEVFASHNAAANMRGIHNTITLADSCFNITATTTSIEVPVDTIELRDSVLIEGENVAPYWQKRDSIIYAVKDTTVYDTTKVEHPAAALVRQFAAARPAGSSEWFMPSTAQWMKVLGVSGAPIAQWTEWGTCAGSGDALKTLAEKMQALGDTTFANGFWVWTSSAASDRTAAAFGFYPTVGTDAKTFKVTDELPVRPFFAF